MDESTSNHTHPPSRQQAAVGGSRASSKATHAPSAKLWKQVNVHRTLRPLHGPPRARSLHSTSLPYCGYVGGPDGPACTVSGCRELPSRLAGSWGPSDSAMRFSSPGVLPSSGASTSQQWRQPMPMTCERNLCPTGEGRDGTGPSSRYEGRVFQPLLHCAQEKRWVTTNLGSAHLDAQDAHAEPRLRMHPSPSSVCSIDLKTRTSRCRSFRATGHSCGCVRRTSISVQVLPFGLSLSPRVFTKVAEAALVPLKKKEIRACAFSTTSTTGSYWLSLRISYANTGIGALAPQPVGPSGQLGKEQTLADAEDLFSRYGVWIRSIRQRASRRNALSRCWTAWIHSRTGRGTTETVSEAPGAYGGCGGGHAAGAAPYETASTLAPWPSPEVAMAERHAEGPSHSSLPPNLHPVVRPFIPSGRSAPGTGLQARCGLHRRLRQGLGGHVQRACSVRGLDGSPTALAHQLPRVAGSTPGLEPSQETLTRRACTSPYGQHGDRCVHQPTRWSTLPSHVTTRPPPPPLESEASEVASHHSYPGLAQPDSRRAVTSCAPRRMETPSPDGPADLATFWTRTGRPVRVPRDVTLPVVLLPDRWNTRHGRTGTQLAAGPSQICISPSEPSRTDSVQRSERKRSRSCSWHHTGLPGLGSQSWCSSWQPLPGRFLWGRIYWLRDGAPYGTRVQTSGNFRSGP